VKLSQVVDDLDKCAKLGVTFHYLSSGELQELNTEDKTDMELSVRNQALFEQFAEARGYHFDFTKTIGGHFVEIFDIDDNRKADSVEETRLKAALEAFLAVDWNGKQ
jgi:hypothetical protein